VKGEVLLVFDDIAGAGDTVNEQQFVSILRAPVLAAISFLVQEKQAGILDSLPFDQDQREASRDVIASVMDGIPRIQASVPALAHSLFRFFDSNGDGKISRVEIEAAVDLLESANRSSGSELLHDMKPFLLKVLALADLDGSGTIDLEDIQLLAEQLITLVDDVGTGAVEILDHAVASPVIAKAITQPFNAGLRELDQDHSGTLSADEIPFLAGLVAEGRNQIKQLVARAGESSNEFGPVKISPILKCAQQYVADIIDGLKVLIHHFMRECVLRCFKMSFTLHTRMHGQAFLTLPPPFSLTPPLLTVHRTSKTSSRTWRWRAWLRGTVACQSTSSFAAFALRHTNSANRRSQRFARRARPSSRASNKTVRRPS
jgi:hypothetical protein